MMAGGKVDMVFTDPPYGISIVQGASVGGAKPFGRVGYDGIIPAGKYRPIIGDETTETAVKAWLLCQRITARVQIFWGAQNYAEQLTPTNAWIVWDKDNFGSNFGDAELAWTSGEGRIRLFRHQWIGLMKASERGERRVHPTQKPVALAEWCFNEFGDSGDVVLDLFLGSGSTLIACENTGRVCLGMEISEPYCDIIVRRWQNFVGLDATLDGDGRTFTEIAKERDSAPRPKAEADTSKARDRQSGKAKHQARRRAAGSRAADAAAAS